MTAEITQLHALSDRLEGLSGADRETDALVESAFDPEWEPSARWSLGAVQKRGCDGWVKSSAEFTASIDAVVALVERTMAGKIGPITLLIAGSAQAILQSGDPCGWLVQVVAPTAPLALLRALVAAKIEEAWNE